MKIFFISMDAKRAIVRGAGYVAASIPDGNEVNFYCSANPDRKDNYSQVVNLILNGNYDIVMISTTTLLYFEVAKMISEIRKVSNVPILMGGVHPTVYGPDMLKDNTNIDYLCLGEGETFIKEFVNNYGKEELFNINNLVYRRGDKIFSNPLNPPEDLSNLPEFPYHWFIRVVNPNGSLPVSASRGCPNTCTYCCNSTFLKMYGKDYVRHMPITNVIAELKYLKNNYSFKRFHFGDDTILADTNYAKELFIALKSEVGIPYTCMSRPESINEELAGVLKSTGCQSISMGVECGNEKFRRKYLRRFMTNDQIIKAFELVHRAGIKTISFNMIGWPFDNDDELTKTTAALNKKLNPNFVQVTWFYPFPGTKLYDYCVERDLINTDISVGSYHAGSIIKGYENKKCFFKSYSR